MQPSQYPSTVEIPTLHAEEVLVHSHGHEAIVVAVNDPRFGRISTIRLDAVQAEELAATLAAQVAARIHGL